MNLFGPKNVTCRNVAFFICFTDKCIIKIVIVKIALTLVNVYRIDFKYLIEK
jgi:hypothetical protein